MEGACEGEGTKEKRGRTFTMPSMPHPAAMISPQYLSLHHEMLHPPSAYDTYLHLNEVRTHKPASRTSRVPSPGRPGTWPCCACCSACATREAELPSSAVDGCVGVAMLAVCAAEREAGEAVGRLSTSTSSRSCQEESEGCSRHSYTRR